MESFIVYKHTTPNGKVYIGITNQAPERRWRSDGSGYRQNKHFSNAIAKYGWDSIKHEIVHVVETREEACEIEKELILKYESYKIEKGYNQTYGGDYGVLTNESRCKISDSVTKLWQNDEYRQMMSNSHKGKAISGWHHTEEAKQKMSEANKRRPAEVRQATTDNLVKYLRSEKGRKENRERTKQLWLDDDFRKRNTAHLYGNHYRAKKVLCIETGVVFENITSAAKSIGKTRDAIGRVCRGIGKTCGGYHWRFADE